MASLGHFWPSGLGGTLAARGVECASCNSFFGSNLDIELIKFAFLAHGRRFGPSAWPFRTWYKGVRSEVTLPDGTTAKAQAVRSRPDAPVEFRLPKQVIRGQLRFVDHTEAHKIIARMESRGKQSTFSLDEELPDSAHVTTRVTFATGEAVRALARIALAILAEHDHALALASELEYTRRYVRYGDRAPWLPVAGFFEDGDFFDDRLHGVTVHQTSSGYLFALASFFGGQFGFGIVVGHLSPTSLKRQGPGIVASVHGDEPTQRATVVTSDPLELPARDRWMGPDAITLPFSDGR